MWSQLWSIHVEVNKPVYFVNQLATGFEKLCVNRTRYIYFHILAFLAKRAKSSSGKLIPFIISDNSALNNNNVPHIIKHNYTSHKWVCPFQPTLISTVKAFSLTNHKCGHSRQIKKNTIRDMHIMHQLYFYGILVYSHSTFIMLCFLPTWHYAQHWRSNINRGTCTGKVKFFVGQQFHTSRCPKSNKKLKIEKKMITEVSEEGYSIVFETSVIVFFLISSFLLDIGYLYGKKETYWILGDVENLTCM